MQMLEHQTSVFKPCWCWNEKKLTVATRHGDDFTLLATQVRTSRFLAGANKMMWLAASERGTHTPPQRADKIQCTQTHKIWVQVCINHSGMLLFASETLQQNVSQESSGHDQTILYERPSEVALHAPAIQAGCIGCPIVVGPRSTKKARSQKVLC